MSATPGCLGAWRKTVAPRVSCWLRGTRASPAVSCALCSSGLLLSALPDAGLQSLVWLFSPWVFSRRAHVSKYHRTRLTGSCPCPPQRSCKALKKKSTCPSSCLKIQQFSKREALFSPVQQPIYFLPSMLPLTSQSA